MEKFEQALREAKVAFWDTFAPYFPNHSDQDFTPEQDRDFDDACKRAAEIWLYGS